MNLPHQSLLRHATLLLVFPATSVHAAELFWTGATSSDWNTASNWAVGSLGGAVSATVPGAGDNPHIDINGTGANVATISADVAQTIDILVSRGGLNANSPGVLNHTAGTAATGGGNWLDVGTDGGNGRYNLANTAATGGALTGFGTGSGSVSAQRVYVGGVDFGPGGGTGVMNVNTTGTVTVRNDLSVGVKNGNGTLNMDAGSINSGGWGFVGRELGVAGGEGLVRISGGTWTNQDLADANAGRLYFGDGNARGRLELSGGTLNNTQNFLAVGSNNNGNANPSSISVTGGTLNSAKLVIGGEDGGGVGKGIATINGANALINSNNEIWIGNNVGSNGQMIVSAGIVRNTNWFAVGRGGATGVLTINGTGLVEKNTEGSFEIGNNAASNGTVNLDGGTLRVDEIVTGGGNSTFNFNGGVLKPVASVGNFMQGLTTANVKAGGAIVDTDGFSVTINQALLADAVSTGGGLTKTGAGTLTLGGANTYTGLTTISSGTLAVVGSVPGNVTVASGATLAGNGSILGVVNVAGNANVSPGDAPGPGTLNTGALNLLSSSALVFQLDTPGVVGSNVNDLINVTGNLTLDGVLQIQPLAGFGPGTYRIFDYSGSLTNNGLALESAFLTAWPGSEVSTTTANQVNLTVIPEPAAGLTALAGLGLLFGTRRRRA